MEDRGWWGELSGGDLVGWPKVGEQQRGGSAGAEVTPVSNSAQEKDESVTD